MSKTRNKLKLTGLLLTVVMIVSLLGAFSLTASAAAADDLTVTIDTGASVTLKDTDGDGYYEIENADGLYAFAALTEAQNHQNVELTNNIIVNDVTFTYANDTLTVTDKEGNTVDVSTLRPWTPIGKNQESNTAYNKVIEGNGYYISGLYCNTTTEMNGLFARTGTGIKINNLGVVNSCFIGKSVHYNGTFIGYSSEATIQNCYSNAIIVGGFYTGGFVGKPHGENYLTIENSCYFGTLVNMYNGGVFCSEYNNRRQNITNSYYLDGCAKFVENEAAVVMTAEQFATGEVAYRLGDAWGQTIGTDAYPSLGGAKVYYGYTSCADDAVMVYTNIAADDTKPEHSGNITYELNANDNTKHDKKYSCCNKVLIEEHTGGTATCVAKAVCAHCGTSYGELSRHSFDEKRKCFGCGQQATISVTDGTNTYYALDAVSLNTAVTDLLNTGARVFTVNLPATAEAKLFTAIRRALIDTEGVEDGTVYLTLAGVTVIPDHDFQDPASAIFGPIAEDEYYEVVTQLSSITLPDVVTIGNNAFYDCKNLVSITAPKVVTIGEFAFAYTGLTSVDLPEATTVELAAFGECRDLTTIKLPKVKTLRQQALDITEPTSELTIYLTGNGEITVDVNLFYHLNRLGHLSTKVNLVLNCVNANEVSDTTWTAKDADDKECSFTFKTITLQHDGEGEYKDNGDGTHGKVCVHCGTIYGELIGHSFDSTRTCTGCRIPAKAYLGAYDFELKQYVITYYATLPEAIDAVPHGTSYVGALANYDGDFEIKVGFYPNDHTFAGNITVDFAIENSGNFTGKVTINRSHIIDATFDGEVIVKGYSAMSGATFNNTVTVEASGQIWGFGSKFYKTVTNNGTIGGGDYYCNVINNGKISRNELEHPIFFGTVTNYGTIKGGYFDGAQLINAGTVEEHCSKNYVYEGNFEYVQKDGGEVTGDHALTYTASGNVITATCYAKCGYVCTATVSAENATYNGTEQMTATVTYSEGWPGGELTVSYANNVNAGTATASITLEKATASVEFTIAKADSTLTAPNAITDLVYNGSNQALVSAGSSTTGTVQYKLNDGEWSTNIPTATEAGEYTVYYRVVGNENHNDVEPVSLTLEIAKRDFSDSAHKVSAVLDAESFVYDGTEKKPAVTVTIEKDKDWLVTADNYIVSYSANVNAGTATVTITGTGTNCTGTITKTFKITKAPLTVTAENKTMTTGQPLPPFTYTITGFVNGETEDVLTAKPTVSCEANGQTAGTYNITTSGAAAYNYEITYVNGTLSVVDHQHAWTYTADGDTLTATCATEATCPLKTATIKIAAEGKTYDGTPVTATLTGSIDGVVNPTVSYSGNTDAGTHTASITLGEATASVEFTIAKADSTLTAPNAITDLVYNGSNQSLVSAGSSTTGTVQYKLNDGEWSTNVPTATEAGEYTVYYKLVGDKNHKDVAEASVKVAILSKSAANAEVSFNGNLVYDGNAKTPEITVVFEQKELVPMKDYIVSCSNNVNAGTAAIEITFIGNYEGKVVKSFTIAPRQLVIFWENTNMIYNGNRQTPTAKLFGVIPGDEVGYTVSGWGKFGGTYTAKVEKLTNPNYVLPADATCRFTIDANPIEVAIDVAVDIYDIIPDSAKEAVADAAINAAENALNDAKNASTECINSAVDQITDCVSTKAQEAANTAKSLADALCEFWQNLCSRVSCFF